PRTMTDPPKNGDAAANVIDGALGKLVAVGVGVGVELEDVDVGVAVAVPLASVAVASGVGESDRASEAESCWPHEPAKYAVYIMKNVVHRSIDRPLPILYRTHGL